MYVPANDFSETARRELEKCARCGKCRSVCPIFDTVKDEAFVARGRIALADALRKEEIFPGTEIRTIMSACLMCRRCSEICPSGVEFTEVLNAARIHLARERQVPSVAAFFFRHVLPQRKRFDAAIRLAALGQKLSFAKRRGTLRHLPLLFRRGKWLPPLAKKSALKTYSKSEKVADAGIRIGIFVGCLNNYVYPDVIGAAIELLEKAKADWIVPPDQVCCGMPVLALGDNDAARMLAHRNSVTFQKTHCDCIITLCASCGRMLKQEYKQLLQKEEKPLGIPVYDVSEFLHNTLALDFQILPETVTYHDPCHLRWGQGIMAEPRSLLARASHFEELPGEMRCCGQAGLFHVLFPELADSLSQKKLDSFSVVNARTIASGCPGCVLQMNDLFARSGKDKSAVHLVEVLARAAKEIGHYSRG
jgi:glycolate oxidase iron-sulfur subunit